MALLAARNVIAKAFCTGLVLFAVGIPQTGFTVLTAALVVAEPSVTALVISLAGRVLLTTALVAIMVRTAVVGPLTFWWQTQAEPVVWVIHANCPRLLTFTNRVVEAATVANAFVAASHAPTVLIISATVVTTRAGIRRAFSITEAIGALLSGRAVKIPHALVPANSPSVGGCPFSTRPLLTELVGRTIAVGDTRCPDTRITSSKPGEKK